MADYTFNLPNDSSPLSSLRPSSPPRPSSPLSSLHPSSPSPYIPYDSSLQYQQEENNNIPNSNPQLQNPAFINDARKLQIILDKMVELHISVEKFLVLWLQKPSRNDRTVLLQHPRWATPEKRRTKFVDLVATTPQLHDLLLVDTYTQILKNEFDSLVDTLPFGKFVATGDISDLQKLDFSAATTAMHTFAPTWYALASSILQNPRGGRSSYGAPLQDHTERLYGLTSIICHTRTPIKSNLLPSLMDGYLLGSGVKRRCLQTLATFGVCHTYSTAVKLLDEIATLAKNELPKIATNPQAVVVYDNFNFKDTKRDERLGHAAGVVNLTTACIVICPELPTTGLTQSMHNPSVKLKLHDIWNAPAISGDDQGLGIQITRAHICNAIRRVHARGINQIFSPKEHQGLEYKWPHIDRIQPSRTQFWQLGGINEKEGTISGTYAVHDNIFKDQFQLRKASTTLDCNEFSKRLWLVHGDQLTSHHIRSVKSEQFQAELPYDRRDWLLGLPAWFHIQMNLLFTIVRTHWDAPNPSNTPHSLKHDLVLLGRSHGTRENIDYHLMEPMIAQSFSARVLALFHSAMNAKGYLAKLPSASLEQSEYITDAIGQLSPNMFNDLVDIVRMQAFTIDAWNGTGHNDTNFTTMCRMLQEIEIFLSLRYAVKHGDIGHMRRLVDPLIIIFLGAAQHNYAKEMLFYRWNLSPVNTPELQRSILASGLLNWQGRETTHKAIDLGLEHCNGDCKIEMKCYKNSTHNVHTIFNRVCLTNTWLRTLRSTLEAKFGEQMSGRHTTQSAEVDIFTLGRNIYTGGYAAVRTMEHTSSDTQYLSEDILQLGADRLEEAVIEFNKRHVVTQSGVRILIPEDDSTSRQDSVIDPRHSNGFNELEDTIVDPADILLSLDNNIL